MVTLNPVQMNLSARQSNARGAGQRERHGGAIALPEVETFLTLPGMKSLPPFLGAEGSTDRDLVRPLAWLACRPVYGETPRFVRRSTWERRFHPHQVSEQDPRQQGVKREEPGGPRYYDSRSASQIHDNKD